MRKGYILHMWTGALENPRTNRPWLCRSIASARKILRRYPSWGRSAVEIRECSVRPKGQNGLPDYIIGPVVAVGE